MVVCSNSAAAIWEATKRFQISSYNRCWSRLRIGLTAAGGYSIEVGRIASWASCADRRFRYVWGDGGRKASPCAARI